MKKKLWKKPTIVSLSAKELSKQIKVAARSVDCAFGDFR